VDKDSVKLSHKLLRTDSSIATMGQCATLPLNRQQQQTSQYYANVVYKETPTSTVAYAMQQQQHNPNAGNGRTDSETTSMCSGNSANSNTPLVKIQPRKHHDGHHYGAKYEPPPAGAFEQNTYQQEQFHDSSATLTKKRKSPVSSPRSQHSAKQYNMAVPTIMEDNREDRTMTFEQAMVPFVPEGATPKRCFRLNMGREDHSIQGSISEDSSVVPANKDMVAATAAIFRGLSVTANGTVMTTNGRVVSKAGKSNGKGVKTGSAAKSRQAAKIDKLKEMVEGKKVTSIPSTAAIKKGSSAKKNKKGQSLDSEAEDPDNTQMLSLIPMGEYYDMKLLVKDGAKKLKAVEAGVLSIDTTHSQPQTPTRKYPNSSAAISAGLDPTAQAIASTQEGVPPAHGYSPRSSRKAVQGHLLPSSPHGKTPPKLNRHPRDHPVTPRGRLRFQAPAQCSAFGSADGSDWSDALGLSQGLRSFWNCGSDANNSVSAVGSTSGRRLFNPNPNGERQEETFKRGNTKKFQQRNYIQKDVHMVDDDRRQDCPSSPRYSTSTRIDVVMS